MQHQPVDPSQVVLGDHGRLRGQRLHVLQRAAVVADLRLVPLPPGKVGTRKGFLDLRASEPVSLYPGGVVGGGQRAVSRSRPASPRSGQFDDRLPARVDLHQSRGDGRRYGMDGREHLPRIRVLSPINVE